MSKAKDINNIPNRSGTSARAQPNIVPFPPMLRSAHNLADIVRGMESDEMMLLSRNVLRIVFARRADPAMATANLNSIWFVLLCCARMLDQSNYPVLAAVQAGALA